MRILNWIEHKANFKQAYLNPFHYYAYIYTLCYIVTILMLISGEKYLLFELNYNYFYTIIKLWCISYKKGVTFSNRVINDSWKLSRDGSGTIIAPVPTGCTIKLIRNGGESSPSDSCWKMFDI